jgi:hypothetical protein
MEPDRFDDVAFRMIEEPEPPKPGPRRRAVVATAASLALVGMLAAGAPALGLSVQDEAAKEKAAATVKRHSVHSYDGVRPCRKGEGHKRSSSDFRY